MSPRSILEQMLYLFHLSIAFLSVCSNINPMLPFLLTSAGKPYLKRISTPTMSNVKPIQFTICCAVMLLYVKLTANGQVFKKTRELKPVHYHPKQCR